MKKRLLLTASILIIGAAISNAQTPAVPGTTSKTMQHSDQRSTDWVKMELSHVPSSLQQTLKNEKYKGWENSGVYYNKSVNEYSVDTSAGAATGSYRFDGNGTEVPRPGVTTALPGTSEGSSVPTPSAPKP